MQLLEQARGHWQPVIQTARNGRGVGSVSMPVGAVLLRGQAVDEAIEGADRMLYMTKRESRNRLVIDRVEELRDGPLVV
ncbi:hypothetical protein [Sphingomonas oligophenolica]|uniref:hypothetical protein n=1 Tax=Sphingomonas oligophenolica TaxID=301154 RepID=UPI00112E2750|nr:hypothetical protein [Sphingomonas oligophenolica]